MPSCFGCGKSIEEQYIMKIEPDLEWHSSCLRCTICDVKFEEATTCIMKANKPYCRVDFARLFSRICRGCRKPIEAQHRVIQASMFVFHVDCLSCSVCKTSLKTGDEFVLSKDGPVCQYEDQFKELRKVPCSATDSKSEDDRDEDVCCESRSQSSDTPPSLSKDDEPAKPKKTRTREKPTRIRTVLNEKQLSTLKSCYAANPRPDAIMKERLVKMTGLSPRVIRVWFQNKRCKDKKKSMGMKHDEDFPLRTFQMHSSPKSDDISISGLSPPTASGPTSYHDQSSVENKFIASSFPLAGLSLSKASYYNQPMGEHYQQTYSWQPSQQQQQQQQNTFQNGAALPGPFQQLVQFSEFGPLHIHEYGSML